MKTIWIYVDTRYRVGNPDHIKAFADPEAAERWFKANDAEGVASEYQIRGNYTGPDSAFTKYDRS
jgi:hypothetical protein